MSENVLFIEHMDFNFAKSANMKFSYKFIKNAEFYADFKFPKMHQKSLGKSGRQKLTMICCYKLFSEHYLKPISKYLESA